MTLADFSPIANHLWQSTVFTVAAWLMTLALRKNRASVRYWIWFAASVKFLIPFSLLISIGNKFAWHSSPVITQPQFGNVMNAISEPFVSFANTSPTLVIPHHSSSLPFTLIAVWLCGAIAVLIFWFRSLQQIRAIKRNASPLPLNLPVPAMSSPARMEPGIFGVVNPVLILPEGITDRLTPAQLKSVITHELCHVQRKDNLTAAIHMVVETIFWFHPFVWWIQTRLVAERERSCDEAVISTEADPQIYAEAILSVCKLYIESPLRCVSGVTGSNLKNRIRTIVSGRVGGDLTIAMRAVLATLAIAILAAPILVGTIGTRTMRAQTVEVGRLPSFEVASIKANHSIEGRRAIGGSADRFTVTNNSVRTIIEYAYNIQDFQLLGAPPWINSENYDIEAKIENSLAEKLQKLPRDQRAEQIRLMIQSLLAERFQLEVSHGTKELPIYALVVTKSGSKLKPTDLPPLDSPAAPTGVLQGRQRTVKNMTTNTGVFTQMLMKGQTIATLADLLSLELGRLVTDETGLKGEYDFTLKWTPENLTANGDPGSAATSSPDSAGQTVFAAVEEQLGLKLESRKGPVSVISINHVERPSGN